MAAHAAVEREAARGRAVGRRIRAGTATASGSVRGSAAARRIPCLHRWRGSPCMGEHELGRRSPTPTPSVAVTVANRRPPLLPLGGRRGEE